MWVCITSKGTNNSWLCKASLSTIYLLDYLDSIPIICQFSPFIIRSPLNINRDGWKMSDKTIRKCFQVVDSGTLGIQCHPMEARVNVLVFIPPGKGISDMLRIGGDYIWKIYVLSFFFMKEPALAPPAEWLALFFVPLGLPEGIWCCLGNIWTLRGQWITRRWREMQETVRLMWATKLGVKNPNWALFNAQWGGNPIGC